MRFNPELVDELLPEGYPPTGAVPQSALAAAEELPDLSDRQRRAYLWAAAYLRLGLDETIPAPDGVALATAGFVALPEGYDSVVPVSAGGFVFGLRYLVPSANENQVYVAQVGNLVVPVVAIAGEIRLHAAAPPNPNGGLATCWVRKNPPVKSWSTGILTCRHVVPRSKGALVNMTPQSTFPSILKAQVAEITSCTIDAAVLATAAWPQNAVRLSTHSPAAPTTSVELVDQTGKLHSGTVLQIFHYSRYSGNLFGQRIITDVHANPGDSGALLRMSNSGPALGVYMGEIPDGTGSYEGIAQDIRQVERYFKVALYTKWKPLSGEVS